MVVHVTEEHRMRGFVLREILGPELGGGVTNINLEKNCIMRNFTICNFH